MSQPVSCLPLGEGAVTLTLGDEISPGIHETIQAIAHALRAAPGDGILDLVPAYTTLTVFFEPQVTSFASLRDHLLALHAAARPLLHHQGKEWVIPVRYDGPDLAVVADRTGLSTAEVVARHAATTYRVYLIGFVPGFAFLGELDPSLVVARREAPRRRVAAGSVAIAGSQTGIYPLDTPGGWHLIGRTTIRPFELGRDPAVLFSVGDRVRFEVLP